MKAINDDDRLHRLLRELCGNRTREARELYYLRHPIVATRRGVTALESLVSTGQFEHGEASAREALGQLRAFVDAHAAGPQSYPVGVGPLEAIAQQLMEGRLREDHALALAAEPETADLLSEEYAHGVGFFCAAQAVGGGWKPAQLLHRLLLASARACRTPEARMVRIRAEREWLVTAGQVLMHIADGRVYKDALAAGQWLLQTLDERDERALVGETLRYLGVLHLDPYGSFRSSSNHELEHRMWLTRTAQELGPDVIEGIPTPREAFRLADSYFRRAIEVTTGENLVSSRKALLQVGAWKEILGEEGETGKREMAAETLAALDPMQDPERWLRVAEQFADLGGELNEEKVTAVLSVSVDEWTRRRGPQFTAAVLPPLLSLLGRRDPWQGLRVAFEAANLITALRNEAQRADLLQFELNLFRRIAKRQGINLAGGTEGAIHSLTPNDDPEVTAASLIGIAIGTPQFDDERVGLALLDQAEQHAPALAERHRSALGYLRSLLCMGRASNAVKAVPPRLAEAIVGYGDAIGFDLAHGFLGHALEMWKRVEDLSHRVDAEGGRTALRLLLALSLVSELRIGEPAAAAIRSICRRLTVEFLDGDAALLPILWQIAKGQRWAATLAEGRVVAPGRDEWARRTLESIAESRQVLAEGEVEEPITSESEFFEAWLTSYVRTERYDGDRDWERVANLKMTFDERVTQLMVPAGDRPSAPIMSVDEIQAALGPKSVLLIAYVGEHSDGRAATYGVLITREQVAVHGRVPDFEGNEYTVTHGDRTMILSAVALEVSAIRRALNDDPDPGSTASEEASGSLERALPLFFGALREDLAALQSAGKNHLIVAPADALHFAPIHLFTVEGMPLADHWTVSYLPNLALLARAGRDLERPARGASIGLGFADAAGGWAPIEEAAEEAKQIAAVLNVEPLLDGLATKPAVLGALARSTQVHIATHGALDVDAPALQMLALHPAEDEASRLCAHEILDLDLRELDLVTLSACETALGRVDRSDNLRGLPAALFTAGASTVVGTLWPVESHASQTFFTTFYTALAGGSARLEAFRAAQINTRTAFPEYRDWGPFYLAGAWG